MKRSFLVPAIVIGALFPIVLLAVQSLAGQWTFESLLPATWTPRAWNYVASVGNRVAGSLLSSLFYSLAAVALSLGISWFPARTLARRSFSAKPLVEGLLLMPALLPSISFSLGLHVIFLRLGWADTLWGVILILTLVSYPYMLRALTEGFRNLGERWNQTAGNLGATPWRIFWEVEAPLLLPSIAAGGTVVFLVAFSEFFLVFLIGGGIVPSFTGFLVPFLGGSDRAVASAFALVFLVVPLGLFALTDRAVGGLHRKMFGEPRQY